MADNRKVVGAVVVVFVDDGYDWAAYVRNVEDLKEHAKEGISLTELAAESGVKMNATEAYNVWRVARDKTTLDIMPLRPDKYRD